MDKLSAWILFRQQGRNTHLSPRGCTVMRTTVCTSMGMETFGIRCVTVNTAQPEYSRGVSDVCQGAILGRGAADTERLGRMRDLGDVMAGAWQPYMQGVNWEGTVGGCACGRQGAVGM